MPDTSEPPSKGFAKVVPNRSASTLIPIIKEILRNGTTVITDELKTYKQLAQTPEYSYKKIAHKYNFVDLVKGVHTQNIESLNNKIRN